MSEVSLARPVVRLPIVADVGESALGAPSSRGSHRLAAVSTCPLAWWLRYVMMFRPVAEPLYRLIGTLVHVAVAYWYVSKLPELLRPRWFYAMSLEARLTALAPGKRKLVDQALDVLGAYAEHYADEDTCKWPLRTVWIEHEFKAKVGELDPGGPDRALDDIEVSARLDRVVEDGDGDLWIVDYKCSGRSRRADQRLDKWSGQGEFEISWQVLLGLLILRLRVRNRIVRGFIIRRIKREKPYDFADVPLSIPDRPYRRAGRMARAQVAKETYWLGQVGDVGTVDDVLAQQVLDEHYWACPGTRYGPCDYRRLCAAPEARRAEILGLHYVRLEEVMNDDDESYDDAA